MQSGTDRILTMHAGTLPRPADLRERVMAKSRGEAIDEAAFTKDLQRVIGENVKKQIETEPRDLAADTGKGSESHKAAVIGDTVGDPFKDTSGPSINILLKLMCLVSVVIAQMLAAAS